MQVRALTPSDAAAFQALRLRGLRECPEAFASSDEEEVSTPLAEVEQRLQPKPDSAVLGVLQVNLGVNTKNSAAVALYKKLGFVEYGLERGFMLLAGELHDEHHRVCQARPPSF